MKLFIVIINYNNYIDTLDAMYSLLNQTNQNFECLIIDNASTNESISKLVEYMENPIKRDLYAPYADHYINDELFTKKIKYEVLEDGQEIRPTINGIKFHLLKSKTNLGFGGANNFVTKKIIKSNFQDNCIIIYLNNDTIVHSEFTNEIKKFYVNTNLSNTILTSQILFSYNNKLCFWYNGGYINLFKGSGYHQSIGINYKTSIENDVSTDFITGCFYVLPLKLIEKYNLFYDEQFFLYGEDLDLSIRINNLLIEKNILQKPLVYHKQGMSTEKVGNFSSMLHYYSNRNRFLILKKWGRLRHKVIFYVYFFMSRLMLSIWNGNFRYFLGIYDGLKGNYGKKR